MTGGGRKATATPGARPAFTVGAGGLSFLAPAGARGNKVAVDESQLPFLILFPESRTAPAPDWLKPGTRVTFQVACANIAQAPGQQGASGSGFVQYHPVALDSGSGNSVSRRWCSRTWGCRASVSFG